MRHADVHLADADGGPALQEVVEHGEQALAAFEGEALGGLELGVNGGLEGLGLGELAQDAGLPLDGEVGDVLAALHALLQPAPSGGVVHLLELHADGAAVGAAEAVEEAAQGHARLVEDALGVDVGIELGLAEVVRVDEAQVGDVAELWPGHAERIELGEQVAAEAEGVEGLVDLALQAHRLHGAAGPGRGDGARRWRQNEPIDDKRPTLFLERLEQLPETGFDGGGVGEEARVLRFEEVDVGAREGSTESGWP